MSGKFLCKAHVERNLLKSKSFRLKIGAVFSLAALLACAPQQPQPKVLRSTLDNGLPQDWPWENTMSFCQH